MHLLELGGGVFLHFLILVGLVWRWGWAFFSCSLLPPPPKTEVENFVLRVAAEFSSRTEQLIFLINNYDMMLGVLMVCRLPRRVPGERTEG